MDEMPPETAPFAEKLAAAMARSSKYQTQRKLAAALGTDGSLVGKWLNDGTIPSRRHREALTALLKTPAGYLSEKPRADLLLELEAEVRDLRRLVEGLIEREGSRPAPRVPRGEGEPPSQASEV